MECFISTKAKLIDISAFAYIINLMGWLLLLHRLKPIERLTSTKILLEAFSFLSESSFATQQHNKQLNSG